LPRKALQQGDRGAAVQWAQERLTALGFEVGRIDGYYSSVMMKAVRQFESSRGLKLSGILTPDRYELLGQ
jgi:peptidoglycan hydrolase-like protein with peptidoglycan-binding domain